MIVSVALLLTAAPAAAAFAQSQDAVDAIRSGPLLSMWDTGDEVAAWQDAMNDWLQVNAPEAGRLATDGIYGPNTRDATIDFQRDVGITVD
ncbi:MAG: hypothetical protein ICV72_04180, partial [Aldersonia sp.]|nr:hypothetical protein [Aldersonia sp.]